MWGALEISVQPQDERPGISDDGGTMRDFRELVVWQKGHRLALGVYGATRPFPPHELFGVTAQVRRSATSVPTNTAEGCGRSGDGDLARFLSIAAGSDSASVRSGNPRSRRTWRSGHAGHRWAGHRAREAGSLDA